MSEYVADTHALFWYLTGSPRLGREAPSAFQSAESVTAIIYLPSIVIAELYYLNLKLQSPLNFVQEFSRINDAAYFAFVEFPA
ncbi:MAG: hypothetical protein M3Y56_05400 [Armatimonadota bacterium]|nr:hypothetical protein [Armatimonadota bacterium]